MKLNNLYSNDGEFIANKFNNYFINAPKNIINDIPNVVVPDITNDISYNVSDITKDAPDIVQYLMILPNIYPILVKIHFTFQTLHLKKLLVSLIN